MFIVAAILLVVGVAATALGVKGWLLFLASALAAPAAFKFDKGQQSSIKICNVASVAIR